MTTTSRMTDWLLSQAWLHQEYDWFPSHSREDSKTFADTIYLDALKWAVYLMAQCRACGS